MTERNERWSAHNVDVSETQPPTVGTSAPKFTPAHVVERPTWAAIIYYATDGITQVRLDNPDGVRHLQGRERVIASALVDYASRLLLLSEEAA